MHPGKPLIAERSPVFVSPPTESGSSSVRVYTVRPGDTLYSIAWRFDLDHKGLARANGVAAPFTIRPGQRLRLINQLPPSPRISYKPEPREPDRTSASGTPRKVAPPVPHRDPVTSTAVNVAWVWPISRKPDVEFGKNSKGMDFKLPGGSAKAIPVVAANQGLVVYAGNGIGGYERLIIIKHAQDLLSAYSFNGQMLVAEQDTVKAGAKVADIKNRGRITQLLHFELRKDGKPINPRSLLP